MSVAKVWNSVICYLALHLIRLWWGTWSKSQTWKFTSRWLCSVIFQWFAFHSRSSFSPAILNRWAAPGLVHTQTTQLPRGPKNRPSVTKQIRSEPCEYNCHNQWNLRVCLIGTVGFTLFKRTIIWRMKFPKCAISAVPRWYYRKTQRVLLRSLRVDEYVKNRP